MQYPDDHDFIDLRQVIDGMIAMEEHPQAGRQFLPRDSHQGEGLHLCEAGCDVGNEACGDLFRGFQRKIAPDFGQIGFRRLG